jgi:NodT family efflux transporter outer membrane factor (OMF) lipoprotein
VFGRIRRSIESAQASYEASLEDYRDVMVTLFAEVARNYVGVRETQKRIQFAETNASAQRATLRLTRERHDAGATSGLDVVQAESNLRNTEAQIPSLKIQLNAYLNSLALLLGDYPGALDEELEAEAPLPLPPGELTVSIPADLLRQRPDIRSRERALAAQTARIGVATADLYPRFSLSGFFAVSARDVGDLFDGDSVTWGISLPIRWQLFDRGRIRSAIDLEQARTDQALVAYERTVLQAFAEVENSLVAYSLERTRRDSLAAATVATQRAVELVSIQYQEGLADFQNVLDMERSLSSQQDQLAVSEGRILQDLIALYKALGGGWDPNQEQAPIE